MADDRKTSGRRHTAAVVVVFAAVVTVIAAVSVSNSETANSVRQRVIWTQRLGAALWWVAATLSIAVPAGMAAFALIPKRFRSTQNAQPPDKTAGAFSGFSVRRRAAFLMILLWVTMEGAGAVWLAAIGLSNGHSETAETNALPPFRSPVLPTSLQAPPEDTVLLLAIGGSTVGGDPYAPVQHNLYGPGFSFVEAAALRMSEMFPNTNTQAVKFAYGGGTLNDACRLLSRLNTRPHAIIVYSGHNEIFSQFPPDREVAPQHLQSADKEAENFSFTPPSLLAYCISLQLKSYAIAAIAPDQGRRRLFDQPLCSTEEANEIYDRFRISLTTTVEFCRAQQINAVLMIPACNESGFEPSRSCLSEEITKGEMSQLRSIYDRLQQDQTDAATQLELLEAAKKIAPNFAETEYRLGKIHEAAGKITEAAECFQRAIDNDGYALRADSRIADIYREVAAEYNTGLIDARQVLRDASVTGIIGDDMMHDNCHPNITGTTTLANAVLNELARQKTADLDWPPGFDELTPAEVANAFGITTSRSADVFEFVSRDYSENLSLLRFDPSERLRKAAAYKVAAARLRENDWRVVSGVPDTQVMKPQP